MRVDLSIVTVGVADRYAAQIRELLALQQPHPSAQRLIAASQPAETVVRSQEQSSLATLFDFLV